MDRIKTFKKIMEKSETNLVSILTNHYQITGTVFDCNECYKDGFINLTNASLCTVNEIYETRCEDFTENRYDWIHINIDKIVAFSFLKD